MEFFLVEIFTEFSRIKGMKLLFPFIIPFIMRARDRQVIHCRDALWQSHPCWNPSSEPGVKARKGKTRKAHPGACKRSRSWEPDNVFWTEEPWVLPKIITAGKCRRETASSGSGWALERWPSLFSCRPTGQGLTHSWCTPVSSLPRRGAVTPLHNLLRPWHPHPRGRGEGWGGNSRWAPGCFIVCSWGTEMNGFFLWVFNLGYITV